MENSYRITLTKQELEYISATTTTRIKELKNQVGSNFKMNYEKVKELVDRIEKLQSIEDKCGNAELLR